MRDRLKSLYLTLKLIFKDYCLNCSLAGFNYIADSKYHVTERVFWLICLILSWTGSYYLVIATLDDFKHNSVSIAVGDFSYIKETTHFPSIGLCEHGYYMYINNKFDDIVNGLIKETNVKDEYNYDIEDFLRRVVYHNTYNEGTISAYCVPYETCDDNCLKCPKDNYQKYAQYARANCSELIDHCYWKGVEFDCCKYFLPLNTSNGECYLLNSIHTTHRNSPNWFPMLLGGDYGNGVLRIEAKIPTQLHVLNEEDIPHILLKGLTYEVMMGGVLRSIKLSLQNTVNDAGIRNIDPKIRKCIFADEEFDTKYKFYSFSVCVTECMKRIQLATCNCSHYNMILNDNDDTKPCDYYGMNCLDANRLMSPKTTMLQPWRIEGLSCSCLPSCTEHEITEIMKSERKADEELRVYEIGLQFLPSQIYRRQTVREPLDVVVSIGGIVGLFVGASILSLVELIYFFSIRLFGTKYLNSL